MCTWVGGARVTTGAAWVGPRVPTREAKARWCLTEEPEPQRGWHGVPVQVAVGREPWPPHTHSGLSDSLFHSHSTDRTHSQTHGACSAVPAWPGSPEPSRVTGRLLRAAGSRESCARQTEVKVAAGRFSGARGGRGVKISLEIHHPRAAGSSHHPRLPPLPPSSRGQCSQGRRQCFRGSRAHGREALPR